MLKMSYTVKEELFTKRVFMSIVMRGDVQATFPFGMTPVEARALAKELDIAAQAIDDEQGMRS